MYKKDFTSWNILKQAIDKDAPVPTFQEREIWWCSVGINVGHEIDGKNRFYNRPVLVIRKFNSRIFWGVPLTTKIKDDPHYFLIEFKEREQCVMLSHLRLYDSKRLQGRAIGKLPHKQFEAVKAELRKSL